MERKISLQIMSKANGENRERIYDITEIDDGEEDQSSDNVKS